MSVTASSLASTALVDVKIDSVGSLSLSTNLSTPHGAEIAIEEIDAAGDMSGERLVLASADTGEDVIEGVKAYKYLAEAGEVDFIISGSIDDVNLSWLSRIQEFQIPTPDTWTSCIGIIDMIVEGPETTAPYFMNIASDKTLVTLYINFGAGVLKREMGWDSVVILVEDTVFGEATVGPITGALGPVVGIETKEIVTYDVGTAGFAPLFSRAQTSGTGFTYQVNSVNLQVISSQYVGLQVSIAMTGVNVPALGLEYWEDIGGAGGDISALSSTSSVGFELDPENQRFIDTYRVRYDGRPRMSHFNGFNAYWGLKQVVAAAGAAGGFDDAEVWSVEMKEQDIILKKGGKIQLRHVFWDDDEAEEVIGRAYSHNARFDLTAPYDDTQPSMVVIRWKEDGEAGVVYPPEYATTKFTVPNWVKQLQACKFGCFDG